MQTPTTASVFEKHICVFKNTSKTSGPTVSLNAVIQRIRNGGRGLAKKTRRCNDLAHNNPAKYRQYKQYNLIGTTFSGTFSYRDQKHLTEHSGLITLDIDGLPQTLIPDLLATLAQMPQVVLAFVSPSGVGIKVILSVDPIPSDAHQHKGAYQACLEFFDDLATEFEFNIDTSGSDCSRLCFLAHDPLAIVNDTPTPITWDRDAWHEQRHNAPDPEVHDTDFHGHIDFVALDYISPDADYNVWLEVGMACHNAGVPCEVWDQWSEKGSKYKPGECNRKWQTFDNYPGRKITWATVVHHAKANGYVPKPSRLAKIIAKAPPVEVRERPSFRHFSQEERTVVRSLLSLDPDAGWHGRIPVFTTRYAYLHPLTNKFARNGQPSEVEKRRVWSTRFGNCERCGAVTAQWIDRYLLTAGRYCDGCHKDYPLGSYLELELTRKLDNSIVSEHQGFLGDDPEFDDFRLWEPGMLTHLGAGMATGKSTEIYKAMIDLALQRLGKGIIAVPRIALARFLAYYLRRRDGYHAWGLWHEGAGRKNAFIGEYGAIVCLPSLPRAIHAASNAGIKRLYIAIDELDFSYNLLSLAVEQATAVKMILRNAIATTGLVVSGQTESTLALEAFAAETEAERAQGFYNTAPESPGTVRLQKHADIDGKSNDLIAGAINDIADALSEGHNVYSFSASRRDAEILAEHFQFANPVVYNAYTKGDPRADAVLKDQRLTGDSRLFVGTSAAGVGLSILDPKARTVIAWGLNFGSRDANMAVQTSVRDRGRRGISIHHADYNLRLPVTPRINNAVSLYHEQLKQELNFRAHLPEAGIQKIAHAQALASLADTQFEAFAAYHLKTVSNMPVSFASALTADPEQITEIAAQRKTLRDTEREKKLSAAITILTHRNLLTAAEIRRRSNRGDLTTDLRLAHETANAYARNVGWDDTVNRKLEKPFENVLDDTDIDVATALAENNVNPDRLQKQRRGYIAVNFPKWTAHTFKIALDQTQTALIEDGTGLEITAIDDDRFLGELLNALLEKLTAQHFDLQALATAIREVLQTTSTTGTTFGNALRDGALGTNAYRKARFLHLADDTGIRDWAQEFIPHWYPARIRSNRDTYTLCHAEHADLRLASFQRWLIHQPGVPDGTQIDLDLFPQTPPPDPNAKRKAEARKRREHGATLSQIANELDIPLSTVGKWCKDITPEQTHTRRSVKEIAEHDGITERGARKRTQKQRAETRAETVRKVLELADQGLSQRKIKDKLGISLGKVQGILKKHKVT